MDYKNLPDDADGDVLRRMADKGFDFTRKHEIDFNVDFKEWPPPPDAIKTLRSNFSHVEIFEDPDGGDNFVLLKIEGDVTYDLVVETQLRVTNLVSKYGGYCDSWGVLH